MSDQSNNTSTSSPPPASTPSTPTPSSFPPHNPRSSYPLRATTTTTTAVNSAPPPQSPSQLPPEALALATRLFDAARNGGVADVAVLEQALGAGLRPNMTNGKGDSLVSGSFFSSLFLFSLSHTLSSFLLFITSSPARFFSSPIFRLDTIGGKIA